MASDRKLDVIEHEAAHIVVGLALGLHLRRAVIGSFQWRGWEALGYTWFSGGRRHKLAHGIMSCAGIAWEQERSKSSVGAEGDMKIAREHLGCASNVRAGVVIAREMLRARRGAHVKVVRALLERDLGPRDVARLVLGDHSEHAD